jgi:anti-sigma B factor antagonist
MAEHDTFQIEIDRPEGALVLRPIGDIDLGRSPILRERLRRALDERPSCVIVDLEKATYMDSSGVATLVEALQIARRNSTTLVLCAMQPRVRSVFEIARLDSVFRIEPSVEAALPG